MKANGQGTKTVNLALQGGGSHGAFTWGVLDRLLDERHLVIEGVSGTSAGAMNAAALAQGWTRGGRAEAKATLDQFWRRTSELSQFNPIRRSLADRLLGRWNLDHNAGIGLLEWFSHLLSPYQSNPLGVNPLRTVLTELIDEKDIQGCDSIKLFIAATNVETGRARVFWRHEITRDVLLASACLPFTFQAIEIEGVPYWDGGYMGNPVIWPLIYHCDSRDIAVVQINPLERKGTPRTTVEIMNRVNEISFNASLMAEMRAIAFVQRLIERDTLKDTEAKRLKNMRVHMIGDEENLSALGATSKMNAEWDFLLHLKALGQATADAWLRGNWSHIGERSSIDLRGIFLTAAPASDPDASSGPGGPVLAPPMETDRR
ncbi:alpha/beta hydrolase [Skermanella stibiiresistens SB22]|uniref:Alpha/beta hydrolase n=1 Tax=Skermanella stibiiresistens SB22 TaxID=1385369 RepID=W9H3F5_9PROT|nr:patatin-like phospholipase family protein [Skermanella stibiiresistens]EWY38298.1 alpha/beta hydrolase [Skermanella stibiiresistens SB22]